MHVVVSVCLVVVGLLVALVLRAPADIHVFGWILSGVGLFGLVSTVVLARLRDGGPPHRGRR